MIALQARLFIGVSLFPTRKDIGSFDEERGAIQVSAGDHGHNPMQNW
jgi:hypothetical protein